MLFSTLASSSSGNASVLSGGKTNLLIDAGISTRRIMTGLRGLDIRREDLSAVLITHEHSDHVKGLPVLIKQVAAPIYAPADVAAHLHNTIEGIEGRIIPFNPGECFEVDDITVISFLTPHDSVASCGYSLCRDSFKITCVTDLGHITPQVQNAVSGSDLLMLEANYDYDRLVAGAYPVFLKRRILSSRGHLSNPDSAKLATEAVCNGTKKIILSHLSRDNNTPSLAVKTVREALVSSGASPDLDFSLSAAPPDCPGEVHKL